MEDTRDAAALANPPKIFFKALKSGAAIVGIFIKSGNKVVNDSVRPDGDFVKVGDCILIVGVLILPISIIIKQ